MQKRGFGFIDTVIGVALMTLLFMALFGVLRASLLVSTLARAKAGASAVAQSQIEYLRGVSYSALGTVGGIPSGTVPQYATTTENGIVYVTHTFIHYVDDAADGVGAGDTNGIITDYKRVSVAVSYSVSNNSKSINIVSNFVPPGIETTTNGGTLVVKVENEKHNPVAEASVSINNTSLSPSVNISTFTNTDGLVTLPGAPVSTSYQISVDKSEYSSAQTYARDSNNQNPNPGFLTVSNNQSTTGTFQIDFLSNMLFSTFSPVATSTFTDTFADSSKLISMSSTTVSSGLLVLDGGESSGFARSVATTSAYLISWGQFTATTTVPSGASLTFHIYDGSGMLIPDAIIPGNSSGFSSVPIPLYEVSTSTYPSLSVGANLYASGDSPSINEWSLSYREGPTPLPNIQFTVTGAKTIGSTGAGNPIYKTVLASSTDKYGSAYLTTEWDSYTPTIPAYDIRDACPAPPFVLAPAATLNTSIILGPSTENSLRALVTDNAGVPVSGASVTLSRTGYTKTVTSSTCGGSYFGEISSASDYTVTIEKIPYTTITFTDVPVTGQSTFGASFP